MAILRRRQSTQPLGTAAWLQLSPALPQGVAAIRAAVVYEAAARPRPLHPEEFAGEYGMPLEAVSEAPRLRSRTTCR